MSLSVATADAPTHPWTIEGFARYWAKPQNPAIIAAVVWPDIVGYWPRCRVSLEGRAAYIEGIANFLWAVPGFSAHVCDYAINGDIVFIRWAATGRPPVGPKQIYGVDRILLRDGFVAENRIHSDHPVFEYLARTALLG